MDNFEPGLDQGLVDKLTTKFRTMDPSTSGYGTRLENTMAGFNPYEGGAYAGPYAPDYLKQLYFNKAQENVFGPGSSSMEARTHDINKNVDAMLRGLARKEAEWYSQNPNVPREGQVADPMGSMVNVANHRGDLEKKLIDYITRLTGTNQGQYGMKYDEARAKVLERLQALMQQNAPSGMEYLKNQFEHPSRFGGI